MTDMAAPPPLATVFNCPNCAGAVRLRAAGASVTCVCEHCGSLIDAHDPRHRLLAAEVVARPALILPMGSRGRLDGILWEVVGWQEKSLADGGEAWEEYLLYNPCHGFAFLVQSNGHWNFGRVIRRAIQGYEYDGVYHKPFQSCLAVVRRVYGEFYWRVRIGDQSDCGDAIAPPRMLSWERNGQEITRTSLTYVEPDVVAKQFGIKGALPRREGIAPNQPNPWKKHQGWYWFIAVIALLLGIILHATITGAYPQQRLLHTTVQIGLTPCQTGIPLGVLSQPHAAPVRFEVYAPVNNRWVEAYFTLEKNAAEETIELTQAIEYYHGRDSDGSWSEGSQQRSSTISALPAGTYNVTLSCASDALRLGSMPLTITITRTAPGLGNLVVVLLLIFAIPLFRSYRARAYETNRWSNSGFEDPIVSDTRRAMAHIISDDDEDDRWNTPRRASGKTYPKESWK